MAFAMQLLVAPGLCLLLLVAPAEPGPVGERQPPSTAASPGGASGRRGGGGDKQTGGGAPPAALDRRRQSLPWSLRTHQPPALSSQHAHFSSRKRTLPSDRLRRALQGRCPQHTHDTGTGCACDSGYVINAAGDVCEPGSYCPAHAHETGLTPPRDCECDTGFVVNPAGNGCVEMGPPPPPPHMSCTGQICQCDEGFYQNAARTACVPSQRPPPPPPPTNKFKQFAVESGPCTLEMGGQCVGRPAGYAASETCVISSHAAVTLGPCPVFDTEATHDYLMIDDQRFDGGQCPEGRRVLQGSVIAWQSDGSVEGAGWEICAESQSQQQPASRPPPTPPPPAPPSPSSLWGPSSRGQILLSPSSVLVDGLPCDSEANAVYDLQPSSFNGRPVFSTADGSRHLYWTPHSGNTGGAAWLIDVDLDDAESGAYLPSPSELPPTGSAVWSAYCGDGPWPNARLRIAANLPDAASCQSAMPAVADQLTATCCRPEDGPTCGQSGRVPSECSIDCAHLWQMYSTLCPLPLTDMLPGFFNEQCESTSATLSVLEQTSTIQDGQRFSASFSAQSGVRYEVRVRVSEGRDVSAPCTTNGWDEDYGAGTCDMQVSHGAASCDSDLAMDGRRAHYCDQFCGFQCSEVDGVTGTSLSVLPPGETDPDNSIATEWSVSADKGLSFTAAATGSFTLQLLASGNGEFTVYVVAVGTAVHDCPLLEADGLPHTLLVTCDFATCAFGYDGKESAYGDGSGFDLVLEAEAGRAYAIRAEIPHPVPVQITATFYQPRAAAGASGFDPVFAGPLGVWAATPEGHHSFPEHMGCANQDQFCTGFSSQFGIHPGGSFPAFFTGTWVAPVSGPVLLRVVLNCDVPFFRDVEADGCETDNYNGIPGSFGCDQSASGTYMSQCVSMVDLTVTPGAYYDNDGRRRRMQTGGDHLHSTVEMHPGIAQRTDTIRVDRLVLEDKAAAAWQATPPEQRLEAAPPSMDQMIEAGSPAADILGGIFQVHQQPHVVYPLAFGTTDPKGRRRTQLGGDNLHVAIETHAVSPAEAGEAAQGLIHRLPGATGTGSGHHRRLQGIADHSNGGADEVCGLVLASINTPLYCTTFGQTIQRTEITIARDDVEAAAWDELQATPLAERTLSEAPSLEEMLVSGSAANALLASMFLAEQSPLSIVLVSTSTERESNSAGSGRRRLQKSGDYLHVTVETHAATAGQAHRGVQRLADQVGGVLLAPDDGAGYGNGGDGGAGYSGGR